MPLFLLKFQRLKVLWVGCWSIALFVGVLCHVPGWAVEKFDWSTVLAIPPGTHQITGNQILHFIPRALEDGAFERVKAPGFHDRRGGQY